MDLPPITSAPTSSPPTQAPTVNCDQITFEAGDATGEAGDGVVFTFEFESSPEGKKGEYCGVCEKQ